MILLREFPLLNTIYRATKGSIYGIIRVIVRIGDMMLREIILNIFAQSWPTILICLVIIISMRIVYVFKNKTKVVFYKEVLGLGFIVYIMCLFYVVTFQDVSWSTSNFIPFQEMFRYQLGTRMFFKNVGGNMLMFVPFGFFVSYFLKLIKPYSIIILTILTSVTIETTQLMIGRVFDIDDIILNIVGGLAGFILYYLIHKFKDKLPKILKKPFIYNIIIILILVFIIMFLMGVVYV